LPELKISSTAERLNSAVTIWQLVERIQQQPGIAHVWVESIE